MGWYQITKGHTWGHGEDRVEGPGVVEIPADVDVELFVPWKLYPVAAPAHTFDSDKVDPLDEPLGPAASAKLDNLEAEVMENPDDYALKSEGSTQVLVKKEDLVEEEWADMSERLIDILEDNSIMPEDLPTLSDEDLLNIRGVGQTYLSEIRSFYPKA